MAVACNGDITLKCDYVMHMYPLEHNSDLIRVVVTWIYGVKDKIVGIVPNFFIQYFTAL